MNIEWKTFEEAVEYGEKGSRVVDYPLLLALHLFPNAPTWLKTTSYYLHHSRDLIELGTCFKELGLAYRGMTGIDHTEGARLHGKLNPTRRWGDAFICLSAIATPLAIAHEWWDLPLGRFAGPIDAVGKWAIAIGHGVSVFGVDTTDKDEEDIRKEQLDMFLEALFFGMEAGFLEVVPVPLQTFLAVTTGSWGLWRIHSQHG
ncbi:MAG: hypothetical protein AB7F31_00050 [Parachlamydiales bacterium]